MNQSRLARLILFRRAASRSNSSPNRKIISRPSLTLRPEIIRHPSALQLLEDLLYIGITSLANVPHHQTKLIPGMVPLA